MDKGVDPSTALRTGVEVEVEVEAEAEVKVEPACWQTWVEASNLGRLLMKGSVEFVITLETRTVDSVLNLIKNRYNLFINIPTQVQPEPNVVDPFTALRTGVETEVEAEVEVEVSN